MHRLFLALGALSGLVGVAAGAFGAHALRERLPVERLAIFETGVRYQLVHALVLLFVSLAAGRHPSAAWSAAGWLLAAGSVLFSGSLYALALGGPRWLGAITPFGGTAFLAAWALLLAAALRGPH